MNVGHILEFYLFMIVEYGLLSQLFYRWEKNKIQWY